MPGIRYPAARARGRAGRSIKVGVRTTAPLAASGIDANDGSCERWRRKGRDLRRGAAPVAEVGRSGAAPLKAKGLIGRGTRRALSGGLLLAACHAGPALPDDPGPALAPDDAGATARSAPALAGTPGSGSHAGLRIRAALGFSGAFRLGHWAPLTLTLDNRGADLAGYLEVRVPDGDPLRGRPVTRIHRRPVDLPGDSRKRFRFTVFLKSFSRPLVVHVSAGGRVVARQAISLRSGVTNARMVLALGRDLDLDYLNDESGRRLRVLYPRPERLPDHWAGYDGVAALILHGTSLDGLRARQYQALVKWLAGGGTLAVSGGPGYALLGTPRLAELLPGVPVGLARLPGGPAAGRAPGAPGSAPGPFHVNLVPRFEGRVLHQAEGAPLVIERRFGRGRVLYLTFDVSRPPFDTWPGMEPLWHGLLDLAPLTPLSSRLLRAEETSALPALIRISPFPFPRHAAVLGFVALYLGVLGALLTLRPESRRGRRSLPWLHCAAPVLFAPAAFFVFGPLLFPSGPVAVVSALIAPHPRGPYADLDLEIGLFSGRGVLPRLPYLAPEPVFRLGGRGAPRREATDWRQEERARGGSLQPAARGRYRLHVIEGRDLIVFDLRATLAEDAEGWRLAVRNRSGRTLRDLWLVLDGHAYALGTLGADAEWTRTLRRERDAVALQERSWRRLFESRPDSREAGRRSRADLVDRELAALREAGTWSPDEGLLLGFPPSPLRFAPEGAAWRRHELALVLLRVPATRLAAPDPRGFRR